MSVLNNLEIVGLGEVLMDIFEDGTATLGGAPLNVAFHCHQLFAVTGGGTGTIVSAIGRDVWADRIENELTSAGLSTEYIQRSELPTGTAIVRVANGEAGFEITSDVAWDTLRATRATDALAARCNGVAFGSLAQRSDVSYKMIRDFVGRVSGIRLYDVNLRRNATNGIAGYNEEIVASSCAIANIVKMNLTELNELSAMFGFHAGSHEGPPWSLLEAFRDRFSLTAVIVTRGARGALFCSGSERIETPTCPVVINQVHPVGAGDAFTAGVLFGLSQNWSSTNTLWVASNMGWWVAQHVSATVPLSPEIVRMVSPAYSESNSAG
jgi:fructokinase